MNKSQVYSLIREGKYDEAACLLIEEVIPNYDGQYIRSPGDAYPLLRKYGYKRKEYFVEVILNGAHNFVAEKVISIGIGSTGKIRGNRRRQPANRACSRYSRRLPGRPGRGVAGFDRDHHGVGSSL